MSTIPDAAPWERRFRTTLLGFPTWSAAAPDHLVGWSTDSLLGFSSYAWRVKHNVAHHTYTNVDVLDDDITQVPLARFSPNQTGRSWYRT